MQPPRTHLNVPSTNTSGSRLGVDTHTHTHPHRKTHARTCAHTHTHIHTHAHTRTHGSRYPISIMQNISELMVKADYAAFLCCATTPPLCGPAFKNPPSKMSYLHFNGIRFLNRRTLHVAEKEEKINNNLPDDISPSTPHSWLMWSVFIGKLTNINHISLPQYHTSAHSISKGKKIIIMITLFTEGKTQLKINIWIICMYTQSPLALIHWSVSCM